MSTLLQSIARMMAAGCCVLACAVTVVQARPVAFWPLDEGSGQMVRDMSEDRNDGALRRAAWCEGKVGGGLRFGGTGTDSYVEVRYAEALELDRAFTIQFWWRKVSSNVQIFFRKGTHAKRYNYYAYLEGKLTFSVTGTDGRNYSVSAPVPPDGWRHMAFIYDGRALTICVDGRIAGSREIGEVRLFTDESPLLLGTYAPGYKHCLAGVLDEVCISDAALRPEKLAEELAAARALRRRAARVEAFQPAQGALVLAKDGKAGATIVIGQGASELQLVPAKELQTCLRKITGVRLPMRDDSDELTGNLILVGESRFTRRMKLPGPPLAGDSFVIKTAPERLVLLGNDAVMADNGAFSFSPGKCKWGTSNAVHAFLHDFCGVRRFMPGRLGEVIPKKTTLEVPRIDLREKPYRNYALGGPWRSSAGTWARRNLLGSALFIHHRGGHLWYSLIPEKQYFSKHPDWFRLIDGKRVDQGNHLCTSNQEMLAEALANLRAIYDQGYEWVELGQTDGYQRCRCAACEAMDEYRDPSGYWIPERPADRVHLFHSALAAGIRKSHPDRKVLIISYGPTGEVPHELDRFPDNVVVEFTHDPPELLARWRSFHSRFTAYIYWFGLYHRMGYGPKGSPQYVASELRRLRDVGVEAYYFCGGFDCWATEAPSYYVAAQLLRNPDLNEATVLGEFCSGLFGNTGPLMERFFQTFMAAADKYRETGRIEVTPREPYRGKSRSTGEIYLQCFDEAALDECSRLLNHADATAANDAARRRIRFFRDGFEYVRLTALAFRRAEAWGDRKDEKTREALNGVLRQREAFVSELLKRQAANGADLPAVFEASREQLLFGPRRQYEPSFTIKDEPKAD